MQIIGVIDQILDKSNPPIVKKVAIIKQDEKNIWCVEFRKNLFNAIEVLRAGDKVRVEVFNDGRIDNRNNYYNNVIAENIERI